MNTRFVKTVAIVLNAPELDAEITERDVICADGGRALAGGAFSHIVTVGDFDSLQKAPDGDEVYVCPVVKDYTDGERAVELAKEKGYESVVIYGAKGGRADHQYCNLSLLFFAKSLGLRATIKNEGEFVFPVDASDGVVTVERAEKGDFVSVLPFENEVVVTDSDGLFYPYNTLALTRVRAMGISNVAQKNAPSFRVVKGSAFVFVEKRQNS